MVIERAVVEEASEKERTLKTSERDGTACRSTSERSADATKRDEVASLRDMQADVRDRTAELRDKASDDHEQAMGRPEGHASKARGIATEARTCAADDRRRAGSDRKQAAEDRAQAAIDLESAQLDDLTGFYRPGLGNAILQGEIERAQRTHEGLVFAYCDVDGLKLVNDAEGHAAGDALLSAMADAMRSRMRSYDPVVRVGGDEFVCALPGVDMTQAGGILRDIQQALTATQPDASMSFGLSSMKHDDSVATLTGRSDDALRAAKIANSRLAGA